MTSRDAGAQVVGANSRAGGAALIPAACGFAVFFLSGIVVIPMLASSALPLPDAPAEQARAWFAENQVAMVATGALQVLSVACLAVFVISLKRIAFTPEQVVAARRATPWGLIAVALMVLSSVLAVVLAIVAPTVSVETVGTLRTTNFISGGTAHVVTLGVFVLLASRTPGMTRPIRIGACVAVVPAVLSLSSLIVVQGAAFILVGRVFCLIWIIAAAVTVFRYLRRAPGRAPQLSSIGAHATIIGGTHEHQAGGG